MQITGIELKNWLAHRHISESFAPLTVIAGPNNAGKSSVADAIEFAMTAALRRITAKGDRPQLITDGADKGSVTLRCGDAAITRNIADGKLKAARAIPLGDGAVKEAVPWLLAPHDLPKAAAVNPDILRSLLLSVMRVDMTAAGIKAKLIERGHAKERLDNLPDDKPVAEWRRLASQYASEHRGAWRAITGETYGSAKAEIWEATAPDDTDCSPESARSAQEALDAARDDVGLHHRELGVIDQAEASARHVGQVLSDLRAKAAKVTSLAQSWETRRESCVRTDRAAHHAEEVLADVNARFSLQQPLACPHCNGSVVLDAARHSIEKHIVPTNPAGVADRDNARVAAVRAREAAESERLALQQIERNLTEARAAAASLEAEPKAAAAPANRADVERSLADAQSRAADLGRKVEKITMATLALRRASQATAEASNSHVAVQAWTGIAAAIEPSGIPGEMLAGALKGINDTLRWIAGATQWRQVEIGEDMAIRAGGRLCGLLSESEKWRVGACLGVAIAIHSDVRFVVLDGMDVLEPSHRRRSLEWLYGLTQDQDLDTAIVIATMARVPEVPSDVAVIWLGESQQAAAA